jgi:allophanate hydrolase subunit 1
VATARSGELRALAQRVAGRLPPAAREIIPGWKHLTVRVDPLELNPVWLAERIDAALAALDLRGMNELVRKTLALAPDAPAVVRARAQVEALLRELG